MRQVVRKVLKVGASASYRVGDGNAV